MKKLFGTLVKGEIGADKNRTTIHWLGGTLITDEPRELEEEALAPDPYTLLLSSLITCTLVTLKTYTDQHGLTMKDISMEAKMYYRIVKGEVRTRIERRIIFDANTSSEWRDKLLKVAEQCPVAILLKQGADLLTVE